MKRTIFVFIVGLLLIVVNVFADNVEIDKDANVTTDTLSSANLEDNKTDTDNLVKSKKLAVKKDEKSIEEGKRLFEQWCKRCHNAYSTATIIGPGLKGLLKNDVLPKSKKSATAENVLSQISIPYGKMPAFGFLDEEDKLNIIAFLNTL